MWHLGGYGLTHLDTQPFNAFLSGFCGTVGQFVLTSELYALIGLEGGLPSASCADRSAPSLPAYTDYRSEQE